MISINGIQEILANALFSGDMIIAGLVMFTIAVLCVFAIVRNLTQALLVSLPIMLIFANMGVLQGDILILLIIIAVVGIAMAARSAIAGEK